jgi:hypothetical protein
LTCDFTSQRKVSFDSIDSIPAVDLQISVNDVKQYFQRVNPRKSYGPDGVSNKALQACADQLALPFQKLFQLSLDSGIIPDLWNKLLIVPVAKKKGAKRK